VIFACTFSISINQACEDGLDGVQAIGIVLQFPSDTWVCRLQACGISRSDCSGSHASYVLESFVGSSGWRRVALECGKESSENSRFVSSYQVAQEQCQKHCSSAKMRSCLEFFFFFCLESPLLVSYFGLAKAVKYDCLAAMKGTPPIRSTYRSTLGSPCLLLIIQPLRPLWKQPLDN